MTPASEQATSAPPVRAQRLGSGTPDKSGAPDSERSGRSGAGGVNRYNNPDCALFRSDHVEWGTPPDLRESLDKEFRFTLDPCTPGEVWDGCAISWVGHRVFCNPPYGRGLKAWLEKGPEAELAVFLLPARTDTGWFHDYALKADEIRFFRGRLKFVEGHVSPRDDRNAAPFPSMLVIFRAGGGGAERQGDAPTTRSRAGSATHVIPEK